MAKRAKTFLKIKKLNNEKEKLFNSFSESEKDLEEEYRKNVRRFLRWKEIGNKNINELNNNDIANFFIVLNENGYSYSRKIQYLEPIKKFRLFLITQHGYSENYLSKVLDLVIEDDEEGTESKGTIYTLEQLNSIREFNKRNLIDEYIFEVYFQLRIQKKDLRKCIPKNSVSKEKCFHYKNEKFFYNRAISQLLEHDIDSEDLLSHASEIDHYYFRRLTQYMRSEGLIDNKSNLIYQDIEKSHDKYILRCPNCGELTENIGENWVLIKTNTDSDFRLYCRSCKGNGLV